MKPIYLDYAATTPMDPRVKAAMEPYFERIFGNSSSLHRLGQEASAAVFKARRTIAYAVGADYREIIFTGSATEANNLALRGALRALAPSVNNKEQSVRKKPSLQNDLPFAICHLPFRPRIVISAIEHESVSETAKDLERDGVEVIYLPVSREGIIDLRKLRAALNERTALVSVIYASNTIGTIQPLFEAAKIIQDFRKRKFEILNSKSETNSKIQIPKPKNVSNFAIRISDLGSAYPLLHTDAVQAFQYLDCDVNNLGVDLMTLSAHKIYGPKGIGALYVRNPKFEILNSKQIPNTKNQNPKVSNLEFRVSDFLSPLVTGGGQEFGLRSGTENVPYIIGFAKAVEIAVKMGKAEAERTRVLRDKLILGIKKIIPGAIVNGSIKTHERLSNNLNIYIPKIRAGELLVKLDLSGIALSAGPACASRAPEPASVLLAMGVSKERAASSVRFTLGRQTTAGEIDRTLSAIRMVLLKTAAKHK